MRLIVALAFIFASSYQNSWAKTKSKSECKKAEECVVVQDGCCSCSAGGKARAIPKNKLGEYETALKHDCKDKMCAQMISNHWTCENPKLACVKGKCTLQSGSSSSQSY